MKGLKKILTGILAGAMALSMTLSAGSAMKAEAADQTITVNGAVENEKYNIYRMLDLDVANLNDTTKADAYMYTINDKWKAFWTGDGAGAAYVDTNTVGTKTYVSWKDGKDTEAEMEAFGKLAATYAAGVDADYAEIVVGTNKTASWANISNGYYLVTSTLGSAVAIASTPANSNNLINEKNQGNTTEKKVKEGNDYVDSNDGAIGDTVEFRSKVTIAKNSVNVVYHDTMTNGLTWTGDGDVKVYKDEALTAELEAANYTVAAGSDGETFTVAFDKEYLDGISEASVNLYIYYKATINSEAVVETADTNTPKITWGNNGKYEGAPTSTYTRSFKILKYNAADSQKNPLAGAKFKLYTSETEGTPLKLATNETGTIYRVYVVGETLPSGFTATEDDEIVTLSSGEITVEGVDSVNYYLEETEAPTGFNKLTERFVVRVDTNNAFKAEIPNGSGATLPSTGGIGTTIFYIIGGLLIVAAVVFFVVRRKSDAE